MNRLVTRKSGIDFEAPGIDPACHVLCLLEAFLPQPLDDSQTSPTVMAVHYDSPAAMGLELVGSPSNLAHGEQLSSGNIDQLVLVKLPTVQQKKVGLLVLKFLNLLDAQLQRAWIQRTGIGWGRHLFGYSHRFSLFVIRVPSMPFKFPLEKSLRLGSLSVTMLRSDECFSLHVSRNSSRDG